LDESDHYWPGVIEVDLRSIADVSVLDVQPHARRRLLDAARGDGVADHDHAAGANDGRDEDQEYLTADPQAQAEPADVFLTESVAQMREPQLVLVPQMFPPRLE
jgi:hypothetical protein